MSSTSTVTLNRREFVAGSAARRSPTLRAIRAWRRGSSSAARCGSSGPGQLNLSCVPCHDERAGARLGGARGLAFEGVGLRP
jgi:hypothetical protein